MRYPFELLNFRNVQGRKDPARYYTIIEGMMTLGDRRIFVEAFLNDRRAYSPGNYAIEVDLDSDRQRRLTVFVRDLIPLQNGKPASAGPSAAAA